MPASILLEVLGGIADERIRDATPIVGISSLAGAVVERHGPRANRAGCRKDSVHVSLDERGNPRIAVETCQAAEIQRQLDLDVLVRLLVALEYRHERCVIGREVSGAVVGEDGDAVPG